MTTNTRSDPARAGHADADSRHARVARIAVGSFDLATSAVHITLATQAPDRYKHFADAAIVGFVHDGWRDIFMAHPTAWGLAIAAGEACLAILLLAGGAAARIGYVGVIAFNGLLLLFGWGFAAWSVPAICVLAWLAKREFAQADQATP